MTNSQMSHVKCQRSGFSLLEVLIVIGILSIVGVAGAQFYGNYTRTVELEATAKAIISDLKTMQAKSIAGDNDNGATTLKWGVHFVNGASDYYETFNTLASGTGYGDASTVVKSTTFLGGGITFTDPAEAANKDIILKRINGGIDSSSTGGGAVDLSITIQSANSSKIITVTKIGNIY